MINVSKKWLRRIIGTIVVFVVVFWLTQAMTTSPPPSLGSSVNPTILPDSNKVPFGGLPIALVNTPLVSVIPEIEPNLVVEISAHPWTIPCGGTTEIRVLVTNADNIPVQFAGVRLESGGGIFSSSGMMTVVGATDKNGIFETIWYAPNPATMGYHMDLTVTKSGYSKATSTILLHILNT